jgi:hypothetical protein
MVTVILVGYDPEAVDYSDPALPLPPEVYQ